MLWTMPATPLLVLLVVAFQASALSNYAINSTDYVEWMQVNQTLKGNWPKSTSAAQKDIIAAAKWLNTQGPWSVVNKTLLPPSRNIHDYYSLAPYWWPDCSNVDNTTQLTPQQISTECNYVRRDGQVNPDRRMVNDTGAFASLSAAVFYNVLSWRITGQASYANTAAGFIDTWFLHNATAMTPNLEYAQVIRGPKGSIVGTREGILDLHNIAKIASAIQVMRDAKAPAWTMSRNSAMVAWCERYLTWLLTNTLSLAEKNATNNHGTFWYQQVASIQVLVGDSTGATATLHGYFNGIYQNQINATGDQPFEAARTRPFHYRAYELGGILAINRIADYLGWNAWNITTAAGTNVQNAVDFSMTLTDAENNDPSELFPSVAAVASHYGDPTGKYATYLFNNLPSYKGEAYYFWDQPQGANTTTSVASSNSSSATSISSSSSSATSTSSSSTAIASATALPTVKSQLTKSAAFAYRPSIMTALTSLVLVSACYWFVS